MIEYTTVVSMYYIKQFTYPPIHVHVSHLLCVVVIDGTMQW